MRSCDRGKLLFVTRNARRTEVSRVIAKYHDVPADLADACLVYAAGQLSVGEILTLDRDFEIYRWGRAKPFHLLIALD